MSSYGHVVHTTANRSFHVVERTRMSAKCRKMKNARAKRAKLLVFVTNIQICDVLVAVLVVVAQAPYFCQHGRQIAEEKTESVPAYVTLLIILIASSLSRQC